MELLESTVWRLNISTHNITTQTIQDVLSTIKRSNTILDKNEELCKTTLDKIWLHLTTQLVEFDDQLLMSICFYSVLSHSKNQEFYLRKIIETLDYDIVLKQRNIENGQKLHLSISLCYGMFQSSYLLQKPHKYFNTLHKVLELVFSLLSTMAYEYSQYTYINFKIMSSFKKVIGTKFQNSLFNRKYQIKILNLINHNWENPITGVRGLNRLIFQTLLLVLDSDIYETVFEEINCFYWNKAKFLMLAEIIEEFKGNIEEMVLKNNWIEGLIYSLNKPGLVSAGTDMYNSILKKISLESIWITLFLSKVIQILDGSSFKAIENFTNYWCLNTLKKFPSLMHVFINKLKETDNSQNKQLSTLCIMKQGTKLGLIERTWNILEIDDTLILRSLQNCNTSIRMLAFEIFCISQGKYLLTDLEYEQILSFLYNNVNSDCTVLRISMINSLTSFLNKLHACYLNTIQANNIQDIRNLQIFCQKLQEFVLESLEFNGNYQRKITTIKIIHVILKCFNENSKKKQVQEKNKSLLQCLKENGYWILNAKNTVFKLISLLKDPANDVHQGVFHFLTEYYSEELSDKMMINHLIQEGLKCIGSKFFYEVSCGHNIFQLIINILMNNNIDCQFKKIEDIFELAYKEITLEYNSKRNIVQSIEDGKQLHSFLSLLCMVFTTSIRKSYELKVRKEKITILLSIVENISNQFVIDNATHTSSDFSKINVMVESLIESSGCAHSTEDETKISGLHQIVLNSLWLNVKASCELASILIQNYKNDPDICKKCLNIITHVLETSRHKGAIEAAGCTLGQGIHFLTSLADELDVSKLPFSLLEEKLNDLFFETSKMSSVTRRGAGLSIMVHRIVSNDIKKGKPLFHYFMKTLLNKCNKLEDCPKTDRNVDTDVEKDLPKAIYIHFLTRIVTDSSLASECMYYSAELAALAFDNLTNSHWQIRNAALQLYGALIPKLIGQKKASGTDDETLATVACDEFRTHSPKLWEYIIEQIHKPNGTDIIQAHSNLVPILNVLSSVARRYNFKYDILEQETYELSLLPNLFNLLGSPIYTVRRITSQCIINMYSFDSVYTLIMSNENFSEHCIHGVLLLILNCYKIYYKTCEKQIHNLIEKYSNIVNCGKHCYICKWNLEKLPTKEEIPTVTVETIKTILNEEKINRYEPGVSLWTNIKIRKYLNNINWEIIPDVLSVLSEFEDFEKYCELLIEKIQDSELPKKILATIANTLLSGLFTKSSVACKLLYIVSQKAQFNFIHNQSDIIKMLDNPSYKMRYIVPFASRSFVIQGEDESLVKVSECIYSLCNPEYNDVDMRYIATLSNNELTNNFDNHSDYVKINAVKTSVILLQDEDEDIRNLCVAFYKNIVKDNIYKNPFICLSNILKKEFLCSILSDPISGIEKICTDLGNFIDLISTSKSDNNNPFANDAKNIYLEINVLRRSLEDLSKSLLNK
ncbi:unnamed protein product, partial [Brenthis ino]